MKDLIRFILAALAGLVLYIVVFGFVVDRPMTMKPVADLIEFKRQRAAATPSPKIAILAGSNARMSHACSAVQEVLGRPCVNLGTTAGLGLDYLFDAFKDELKAGDVVYLPLEYQQYGRDLADLRTGPDAAILFRHDKAQLLQRGPEGVLRAAFLFDIPVLIRSVGEIGMAAVGIRRSFDALDEPDAREGEKALDAYGDGVGHTAARAGLYRDFIEGSHFTTPDLEMIGSPAARGQVEDFLTWSCRRGVLVIGGLPTTFDDTPIPDEVIASLQDLYTGNDQAFLVLPTRSQYGRSSFYDSEYHLNREAQLTHSRMLAEALGRMIERHRSGQARACARPAL